MLILVVHCPLEYSPSPKYNKTCDSREGSVGVRGVVQGSFLQLKLKSMGENRIGDCNVGY